jgi:hypothetical protein
LQEIELSKENQHTTNNNNNNNPDAKVSTFASSSTTILKSKTNKETNEDSTKSLLNGNCQQTAVSTRRSSSQSVNHMTNSALATSSSPTSSITSYTTDTADNPSTSTASSSHKPQQNSHHTDTISTETTKVEHHQQQQPADQASQSSPGSQQTTIDPHADLIDSTKGAGGAKKPGIKRKADSTMQTHPLVTTTNVQQPQQQQQQLIEQPITPNVTGGQKSQLLVRRESNRKIKKPKYDSDVETNDSVQVLHTTSSSGHNVSGGLNTTTPCNTQLTEDLKQCQALIKDLFSKKHRDYAWPFYDPVDVVGLQLVDYYDIIKKPMDLGTHRLINPVANS